ncbi:TatD DNase family protein [Reichenbachiella faecimaris]|uniref:TatD DNase family protein n=1 Tax=Reichenbachiella faecimaris TaxID=692418 RepID=A0A1W2G664_REIFA|nr:TatD family hydrolase [Reichenbachiella faecimaris]SMD32157.1 TatD DNase family protein [Reichenbachiella faecimaris]
MQLVETHAHIYSDKFKDDVDEMIQRSREQGVEKIYMPNIDSESIDAMLELEYRYPGYCIPMMGLHPCSVDKNFEKELYIVEDWLNKREFVAVGEMGTDLYWDKSFYEQQKEAFKIQSKWAIQQDRPIVIHCRESIDETIALVDDLKTEKFRGIFHCFSGTVEQANQIIELGFLLGIGGVATFKNGGLEPVLKSIPLDHLVLETDSPYLAPVPNRGKRNEPAYLNLVAEKIAAIKNITKNEVAKATTENAYRIFN